MGRISSVGIVGLGTMGAGIAEVVARHGIQVVGAEVSADAAAAASTRLERSTARAVERGKLTEDERAATLAAITVTTDLADLKDCQLVIEAVPEDARPQVARSSPSWTGSWNRRRSSRPTRPACR